MSSGNSSYCPDDCHPNSDGYGICETSSGHCFCQSGWIGASCSVSFSEIVGPAWHITGYVIGALFSIVAIVASIQLIRIIRSTRRFRFDALKLVHGLLIFEGIERCIYFIMDPFGIDYELLSSPVSNFFYGLGISIPLITILILLYYRVETYMKITLKSLEGLGKKRALFLIPALAIFLIEMMFDLVRPSISSTTDRTIFNGFYYIFVIIITFSELYILFIYGRKTYKEILDTLFSENLQIMKQRQLKRIQLVLFTLGIETIIIFLVLLATFIFEESTYHYTNGYSYLVEMTIFEALLMAGCFTIIGLFNSSLASNKKLETPSTSAKSDKTILKSSNGSNITLESLSISETDNNSQ